MMNDILRKWIDKGQVIVYLDDVLIFSETREELERITLEVLGALDAYDLKLNIEKCEWEKEEISFLGHLFKSGQKLINKDKIKTIQEWNPPVSVKEIQRFLGFANFYRRFIEGYSKIVKPLTMLTRKRNIWKWGREEQSAFETLKEKFTTEPVLAQPNDREIFILEVDASNEAVGAVLSQRQEDGKTHPIGYFSKTLNNAERNYSISEKELLGLILALEN